MSLLSEGRAGGLPIRKAASASTTASVREDRPVTPGRVTEPVVFAGDLKDTDPILGTPCPLTAPGAAEIEVIPSPTAMTRPPGPTAATVVSSPAHSVEAASPIPPVRSTALAIGVAVSPTVVRIGSARSSGIERDGIRRRPPDRAGVHPLSRQPSCSPWPRSRRDREAAAARPKTPPAQLSGRREEGRPPRRDAT